MTPEQFRRVDAVFNAACGVAAADRGAFLNEACRGDLAVRAEVEALLAFDTKPGEFLKTPALAAGLQFSTLGLDDAPGIRPIPPERVGGYRILRLLGEGGFGCVYLAEQDNPRRTVAVKILKPRAASTSALKRFEFEAQILARLQHPGIAQVYEAGASRGEDGVQAWFAMEYVRGRPLDADALARGASIRERLALVAQVCDAVQYAHQKGVIHRDLKPANILVVEEGLKAPGEQGAERDAPRFALEHRPLGASVPSVKILDFGVARTTEPDHDLKTLQASVGQIIGTLSYMSPEQIVGDQAEIDTRSDVYALGVILYQLLTGMLPHDLSTCSIAEAARRVRDVSPQLLGALDRNLRGEIETIVAKAMARDKAERYQSAAALADELRRFLSGAPIEAKRHSRLYVLRKNMYRYRGAVATGALFIVMLAAFGVSAAMRAAHNSRVADEQTRLRFYADQARVRSELAQQRAAAVARERAAALRTANIERGRLSGRMGNVVAAEDLLWREFLRTPDAPDTFWALTEYYARHPCRATVHVHSENVNAIALSPDGRTAATGGREGIIKLWDTETWRLRTTLSGHADQVNALAFSPDGTHLLSGSQDTCVTLWRLADGRPVFSLNSHEGAIRVTAFHPAGDRFITCDTLGTACIWRTNDGECLEQLPQVYGGIWSACFSRDGEQLAIGATHGAIHLWSEPTGAADFELHGHTGGVSALAFSYDGRVLYSGSGDRHIRAWDIETRRCIAQLPANNGSIRSVIVTPDDRRLLSFGWWRMDVWNVDDWSRIRSLPLHERAQSAELTLDGRRVLWGCQSGELREFEIGDAPGADRLEGHVARTAGILNATADVAVTGDSDGRVRISELSNSGARREFLAHSNRIRALRLSRDERVLITGGNDQHLRIWDAASDNCIAEVDTHDSVTAASIAVSPLGDCVAHTSPDSVIEVRSLPELQLLFATPSARSQALGVAFSPAGDLLAVTSRDPMLTLWSARGEFVAELRGARLPWTPAFSEDGAWLAAGDWNRVINVWDMATLRYVAALEGHSASVFDVAFRPGDPGLLASASADGTVRLWDVVSRRGLATLDAFADSEAVSVSFSADGRYLIAGGGDGTAVIWDLGYYDTHLVHNLAHHAARLAAKPGDADRVAALNNWVAAVGEQRWPRQPAAGSNVERDIESNVGAE